jgi:hypothetical protein
MSPFMKITYFSSGKRGATGGLARFCRKSDPPLPHNDILVTRRGAFSAPGYPRSYKNHFATNPGGALQITMGRGTAQVMTAPV